MRCSDLRTLRTHTHVHTQTDTRIRGLTGSPKIIIRWVAAVVAVKKALVYLVYHQG